MDPVSRAQNNENSAVKKVIGRPFQKGVSGNPGGRPKKQPLSEIYGEVFEDPAVRQKIKEQIIKTMTSKGMAGVLERREAGDRTEGKVAAVVDMNVSGKITLEQVLEAKKKAGK